MKKIRILALILALLMLPLGMLVSCKKDPVDEDGDDEGGDGGNMRPTGSGTTVAEDGTKAGYLCYYTFDSATVGRFTQEEPYTIFQPIVSGESAGIPVIGRRDIGSKKGGYLGIERGKTKTNPYYNLLVMTIAGFSATHVISFDIYVGPAVQDTIYLYGRKGNGIFNEFLSVVPNSRGARVNIGGKYTAYTASTAGEWVNFALAIDDINRVFDVYINGVKTYEEVPYINDAYEDWETLKIDKYRFTVAGSNAEETEIRIDNFGVANGLIPVGMTGKSNVVYTDAYIEENYILKLSDVSEAKQKVLQLYTENSTVAGAAKSTPYASSKLLMNKSLSLAKVRFSGKIGIGDDLQYDYGVELGNYKYGGDIGGKTFYNTDSEKSFNFRSDVYRDGADAGKLIVINQDGARGYYELEGDETLTKVTVTIDNKTTYAVYTGGVFKIVTSNEFNPDDPQAIVYTTGEFHGKDYTYKSADGNLNIKLSPDEISGKTDFKLEKKLENAETDEGTLEIDINAIDVDFEYNGGVLSIWVDEILYAFAYDAKNDRFDFSSAKVDGKNYTLNAPENEELSVGSDDLLSLHYQSFKSGSSSLVIPVAPSVLVSKYSGDWENFNFDIYINDSMKNFSFAIELHCGADACYRYPLVYNSIGRKTVSLALSEFTAIGNPDIKNLSSVEFKMSGTVEVKKEEGTGTNGINLGPLGDTNGANIGNDGCDLYIFSLGVSKEKIAEVVGPDEGKSDCNHKNREDESLLVEVPDYISPTCTSIGYYACRCTECNATFIDDSKDIEEPLGHSIDGQVEHKRYPTCNVTGSIYKNCTRCASEIIVSEIPALAHDYVYTLNNSAGIKRYECKYCGDSYENMISDKLLGGMEKYEMLPEGSRYFYACDGHNDSISVGSFESAQLITYDNLSMNLKRATAKSVKVDSGEYAVEITKGDSSKLTGDDHNPYIDLNVGFAAGAKVVYEVDIMLGNKNASGKYGVLFGALNERNSNGSMGTQLAFFNINDAGVLTFTNDSTPIQLSEDKFTNIAVVIDPAANLKTVYVDGVYKTECAISASTQYPAFRVSEVRIQFDASKKDANTGTSYYYNHIYAYEANAPLCMVDTELVSESKGNLGLYESATPDENAAAIEKIDSLLADKALYLKSGDKSSNYTFSFTLNVSNALKNGTLLKGTKLDDYNETVSAALLTVKDGYLYYMDYAIYELKETAENVEIKLCCKDYISKLSVIVNEETVLDEDSYLMEGTYSDSKSYLRHYTFCADVCDSSDPENVIAYSVKNISLTVNTSAE